MTKLLLLLLVSQYLHPSLPPGKQERVASHCFVFAAWLCSQQREAQLLTVTSHPPDSMPKQPRLLFLKLEPQQEEMAEVYFSLLRTARLFFPFREGSLGLFRSHLNSILIRHSWKQKGTWYFSSAPFFLFLRKISLEVSRAVKSKEPPRLALGSS